MRQKIFAREISLPIILLQSFVDKEADLLDTVHRLYNSHYKEVLI